MHREREAFQKLGAQAAVVGHSSLRYAKAFVDDTRIELPVYVDEKRVIYKALEATKGKGGGDALVAAMKGQVFESPRGPVLIDAQTRDIVQDVYIRRVERKNGQLWNVEIDVNKAVKDTARAN